jgi:hypothetical protein
VQLRDRAVRVRDELAQARHPGREFPQILVVSPIRDIEVEGRPRGSMCGGGKSAYNDEVDAVANE